MNADSFNKLVNLIKDHSVFQAGHNEDNRGRQQAPPHHQLAVFLRYIGTEGSGCSNSTLRHIFSFGHGTFTKYIN